MPNEVQATVDLGLSKGQHRTVFRNPRGNKRYYAAYIDADDDVEYEWSSDGITWSNAKAQIFGLGATAFESFDVKIRDDGTQLVVWATAHAGIHVYYNRGTISDSSDTITWGAQQAVKTSMTEILAGDSCIAIARTDNGRLVVAFTEDTTVHGKDYRQTKLIGSDGDGAAPTWSGETTWDDPSGNTNNQDKDQVWFGLESMSADRVLLYARLPDADTTTGYDVVTAVPTWNGTSFSNTTKQVITTVTDSPDHGKILSALVDEDNRGHIIYWQEVTSELLGRPAASVDDDDWTTGEVVTSDDCDACSLALDTGPATDELYAFYHNVVDTQDFHYKVSPIPSPYSWGTEQTITFASDLIALTSWNRDVESSLHIGIEDADTDVHYHEHALAAPAFIPELPFMVKQAVNRAGTY